MKTLTIISFWFCLTLNSIAPSFAQGDYHPFLEETREWHIGVYPYFHTSIYTTMGDTVINANNYKIFNSSPRYLPIVKAFVREDTIAKKVFVITDYDPFEKILYDFSLVQNDSIFLTFNPSSNTLLKTGWYFVDSIGTIEILTGFRKAINLSNPQNPISSSNRSSVLTWIEGVGSLISPIYTVELFEYGGGFRDIFNINLFCSFRDSIHEYEDETWKEYTDDCGQTIGIEKHQTTTKILLAPNPSSGRFRFQIEDNNSQYELFLYNFSGSLIGVYSYRDASELLIQLPQNTPGLYFLKVVNADGKLEATLKVINQ